MSGALPRSLPLAVQFPLTARLPINATLYIPIFEEIRMLIYIVPRHHFLEVIFRLLELAFFGPVR